MRRAKDLLAEEIIWARTRLGEVLVAPDTERIRRLPLHLLLHESQIITQAMLLRVHRENYDAIQYFKDTFKDTDDGEDGLY